MDKVVLDKQIKFMLTQIDFSQIELKPILSTSPTSNGQQPDLDKGVDAGQQSGQC